jgi:hypothetical protein
MSREIPSLGEVIENKDSVLRSKSLARKEPSPDFKVKKIPLKSGGGQFR